jgi:hypothetical protein|tara:strand:+ start:738 stop:950 length:213 start_codon:yes stop_codon:yes gene_type:complete
MNIKRGFFRLALALSTICIGGAITIFFTSRADEDILWMGLGGGMFIWVCYWVIAGFFKDKTGDNENNTAH